MRGVRTSDERAKLVGAYRSSGLSAKAFAEREGIPVSTLYQWISGQKQRRSLSLRMAKVVRRPAGAPEASVVPLLIEFGHARIAVPQNFDIKTLGAVIDLLASRTTRMEP